MAFQSHALAICLWRLVAAIGVGAEIVAVDAYISEMTPKALRGRGFAISKAIQYCAVPLAAVVATILANKTVAGVEGWRVMLFVPVIGAILIWWVRRGLPESPRWLAQHDRNMEAKSILADIEARVSRQTGRPLPPIKPIVPVPVDIRDEFGDFFRGQLLQLTLMLLIVSFATTIAFFGFNNWLPSLLQERSAGVTQSLTYTSIVSLSYPLAPL